MIPRAIALTALLLATIAFATCVDPPRASASVGGAACKLAGAAGGVGKACAVLGASKTALSAGKKLVSGHVGSAIKTILGGGSSSSASTASTALGLAAMVAWVAAGAQFSISETTKVLGQTTKPQLGTTWFSSAYWRIAGIAALLTLPFLFAAAVQALLRSDLALLTRAAFGYLPLAMLAIGIAAPVTMLLLAATDELCAIVSSAAGITLNVMWKRPSPRYSAPDNANAPRLAVNATRGSFAGSSVSGAPPVPRIVRSTSNPDAFGVRVNTESAMETGMS